MRFRIGPWVHRVRICAGQLIVDGAPADAQTHDGVILLCGLLAPRRRIGPLLDQLRQIHEKHYGPLVGAALPTFIADVMRQLRAQGDEPALMRLGPDMADAGGAEDVAAEPVGCECGLCGTKYGSHQITTGPPELDPVIAKMIVRRWVDCDFCGLTMTWCEGATPAGAPNGRVTSGPEFVKTHVKSRE